MLPYRREINIDTLPTKYGFGANKDVKIIDWKNSIGKFLKFAYKDVEGVIEIVGYNPKNQKADIMYNNEKFCMATSMITSCSFGRITKEHSGHYKFPLGYSVSKNIKIEQHIRHKKTGEKSYIMKCLCCNNEIIKTETDVKRRIVRCSVCGDGISYPEKFIISVLNQCGVKYKKEMKFDWIEDRFYDFYLYESNTIIEVHGIQHYEPTRRKGRSFEEECANDVLKKEYAINNNIKNYIVIDARMSNLEWMKNSIMESELADVIDLNNVDWEECESFSLASIVKEVCDYKHRYEHCTTTEIAAIFKLNPCTVREYLQKGSCLGWCDYDVKLELQRGSIKAGKSKSKKVEIFKNGVSFGVFNSSSELARDSESIFGVKLAQGEISRVCNGKRKTHKGFTFKYTTEGGDANV